MQKHHAYFNMFDQISSKWFAGREGESVRGRDTFIIPSSRFTLRQQQNIKVMHLYSLRGRGQKSLTVLVSDDSSSSGQLQVTGFTYCSWQPLATGMIYSCKQNVDIWLVSTWRFGPAWVVSISTVSLKSITFRSPCWHCHIFFMSDLGLVPLCGPFMLSSLWNVSVFSTRQEVVNFDLSVQQFVLGSSGTSNQSPGWELSMLRSAKCQLVRSP